MKRSIDIIIDELKNKKSELYKNEGLKLDCILSKDRTYIECINKDIDTLFMINEIELISYCHDSGCLEYFDPDMMLNNFRELKIFILECYIERIIDDAF